MSKNILQDSHLSFIESGITILFYVTMMAGAALTSYGVYINSTEYQPIRILLGLLTIVGVYITIIVMSSISQDAYSNLYDDFYRPRRVKIKSEGEWTTITAKKIPKGTSLILAEQTEPNIADYSDTSRAFASKEQEFKLKEEDEGVKFKADDYVEIFSDKTLDDMALYIYKDSPQCRWVGEKIEVNKQ